MTVTMDVTDHYHAGGDACLGHLPAMQLSRIVAEGAELDVVDFSGPAEGIETYRRATLDLHKPEVVAMFLNVLVSPGAVLSPGLRQELGIALPQKLLVFGFIHQEQGGMFISHFMPYT